MKIMRLIILSLVLMCIAKCTLDIQRSIMKNFEERPTKEIFKVFHFLYNKEYKLNSEEGVNRYKIFKANLNIIKEHNKKDSSYKLGVNQFADLTAEEFKKNYLMNPEVKKKQSIEGLKFLGEENFFDRYADSDEDLSNQNQESLVEGSDLKDWSPVDWTSSFGVARSQGNCGSCWTFATAGVFESFLRRKNNFQGYLSTQQLVDCDTGNNGCNGGNYSPAFNYLKNTGLVSESEYPYKEAQGTCSIPSGSNLNKIGSFSYCSNYSSNQHIRCTDNKVYANLSRGASAVGIDGSVIQLYNSGIFTNTCSEDNHAVILVGYGVESGTEFYKIRNSWGEGWGESGYIRIARNAANRHSCYVANESFTLTLP